MAPQIGMLHLLSFLCLAESATATSALEYLGLKTDQKETIAPLDEHEDTLERIECGIWLAPSTIKGAGIGLFAGRDFRKNEFLQEGQGDIVIPLVDVYFHNKLDVGVFVWDEYTWNSENLRLDYEGLHDVTAASPGFGAAANSFMPLVK
jgi:hypothetical protein